MKISLFAATACLSLAACAAPGTDGSAGTDAVSGPSLDIRDAQGQSVAAARITQEDGGVRVRVDARAMPPGTYAAHVHQVGVCEGPAFTSAGEHWNPSGRQHGRDNPAGAHLGDLPNLTVGADGSGTSEYLIPGARLADGATALRDADGSALLIHANADDYRTDPSGNSGGRIACGVLSAN